MRSRYLVTLLFILTLFVVPQIILPRVDLSRTGWHFLEFSALPLTLIALAATRRWGKNGQLLFRRRPADERESRLLAEIDSMSITIFLVSALLAPVVILLGWVVTPIHWRMAWLATPANIDGGKWIYASTTVASILQSMSLFVFIQSIIGLVKFTRDS